MARLGIDRDFLWEFGKLERAIQEKVHASFAKFEQATHAGVHLEKINNVRDARLRSIRIDQSWRGIVLAPDGGVQPAQVGVAARSGVLVNEAVTALAGAGIAAVSLGKRAARDGEVAVATMHRMKGLEFRCVAVVGVGQHQMPAPAAVTSATDDQRSHDLDIQRERCLLFVACTRARENLLVSWHGTPSPLLPT
ncbi:MAG: hypothetical protein M3Y48_02890 [Actinomycetota bacterium]|nr:hypothetical protein [Actinomycetota bacterium]